MLRERRILDGFKVVAAAPTFLHQLDGRLNVDVNRDLDLENGRWAFHASPLAPEYSIHTRIGEYDEQGVAEADFWLDWHDLSTSSTARLLTFVGKFDDVPFEVKQERMERLARAIKAYDSIMVSEDPSSKSKLESTINGGNLPRPDNVVLVWGSADHMGLAHLAKSLGLSEPDSEISIPWSDLLDLAKSGRLVSEWNRLAKEEAEVMFAQEEEDPNAPEIFGKDHFCEAVTGHSASNLRKMVGEDYIEPLDHQMTTVGRDIRRDSADEIVDRYLIFMSLPIRAPILPLMPEQLYDLAKRFIKFQAYSHRFDTEAYEGYWLPAFERVELAYVNQDDQGVREGIIDLVERILKD